MPGNESIVLVLNAGSSSIKIALYEKKNEPKQILSGNIERIGSNNATFTIKHNDNKIKKDIKASDFHNATISLIKWLEKQEWFENVKAIGHRIGHGMHHTKSEIITDELLNELNGIVDYDPDHLPAEIQIIKLIKQKHPQLLQAACFDTAFHTTIPAVAKHLQYLKNILMKVFSDMAFMVFLTAI